MNEIERKLSEIYQYHNLIGMSVLAIEDGSFAYSGSFGLSNVTSKKKVSDQTLYRMASISKTVNATAFMMLVEKGKISLNEDIGDVLGYNLKNPNFPEISITPAMLLSHTSGIRDNEFYDKFLSDSYHLNEPPLLENLLTIKGNYYSADVWGNEMPGTYFCYSNLNYGIIAAIIEKVSAERFDVFCRKNIFEPLQMNASFNVCDIPNYHDIAALYENNQMQLIAGIDDYHFKNPMAKDYSAYIPGSNGMMFGPQGGMRSSLTDLAKFMIMHMNNGEFNSIQLLKKETAELMTKTVWKYNGINGDNYENQFLSWGLGFQLLTATKGCDNYFRDLKMCGHLGDGYGLLSCMYFSKETQKAVIFCTNGSTQKWESGVNTAFYKVVEDAVAVIDKEIFTEKL